jgi:hypothetical protein
LNQPIIFLNFILITTVTLGQNAPNETLVKRLDSILYDDQTYRGQLESVQARYGGYSKEMKELLRIIKRKDSINTIKIEVILNTYGWLGTDRVGEKGNATLFLVIQHSDLDVQKRYLSMMREAVKRGNAKSSSLALLEDRVALRQGKRQIYGTQISWDMISNEYYVFPLSDPDNVDKRRAEVGLEPISDYLSNFNLKWNAAQYKKELPSIEARQKLTKK